MTHARESLETFLGDVNPTDPIDINSERNVVRDIFPEIEIYRERGYSLSAIYSALLRGGDLSCTLTTFRTYYYQERHQRQLSPDISALPMAAPVDTDVSTSAPDVLEQAIPQKTVDVPASNALLGMSDDELETQQALARRLFDQRRAELGIRRRE